MSTANLTISPSSFTATSTSYSGGYRTVTVSGTEVYEATRYYGSKDTTITLSRPSGLNNQTIIISDVNFNLNYSGGNWEQDNNLNDIKAQIQNGLSASNSVSIKIKFQSYPSFERTHFSKAASDQMQAWFTSGTRSGTYSNITCSITYETSTSYSLSQSSVATGEELELTVKFTTPNTSDIPAGKMTAKIVNNSNSNCYIEFPLNPSSILTKNTTYTITSSAIYTVSANATGNCTLTFYNDGTAMSSPSAITITNLIFLSQRLAAPTFSSNFTIQRYYTDSTLGKIISEEGTLLGVTGIITFDSSASTKTITFSGNGLTSEVISVTSGNTKTFNIQQIFSTTTFLIDTDYTITVTLNDGYNTIVRTIDIPSVNGYLNVEEGGVAVGGIAHGTLETPQFECYYPMYLYFNNNKYKVVLGANNTLTAQLVSEGSSETSGGLLFSSTIGTITTSENNHTYQQTSGSTAYVWNDNTFSARGSRIYLSNKKFQINSSSASYTTGILALTSLTNGVSSDYSSLNIKFSKTGNVFYVFMGILKSDYSSSLPEEISASQSVGFLTNVTSASSGTPSGEASNLIYSVDFSSYTSWICSSNYYPVIVFDLRGTGKSASMTIDSIWLE